MSEAQTAQLGDPGALIRSREYRRLLVFAAVIGVLVSVASWGFLELVHWLQEWVYVDLPDALGFSSAPTWWPIPVLLLAGLVTAFAVRLPGAGGHVPFRGLSGGVTLPNAVPGVLLAGLASIGLGLVLGPEAPLIALGSGLAIFVMKYVKKDAPDQVLSVIAAAAAFAALATVFNSPVVGAVILLEAAGLGGPTLPLVLLPGLMSAGIGSLVFVGIGNWTGLDNSDYTLTPFSLPAYPSPDATDFGWTLLLAVAAAIAVFVIVELARVSADVVARKPWLLTPAAGLFVAVLAIAFEQTTDQSENVVLFSGEDAFSTLLSQAGSLSVGTLALLILAKGIAWAVSLGCFRGGPTFPALFLGAVGGLIASHLPGYAETPAVAAMMAACTVSVLRLPLASIVITLLLTSQSGAGAAPIIIVAVVVAYIATEVLANMRRPVDQESNVSEPATPSA